jgi:acetyl esterase/lipase
MTTKPAASVSLWSVRAPYAEGDDSKFTPALTPYLPDGAKSSIPALVICPGGGYQGLAIGHEGYAIAEWFSARGVACFVVKYRLPGESPANRHPVPLLDVQRAIRLVRSRAKEWNLDPHRLALMGFSAGGHLASTAITHFDAGDAGAADPVDRENSRPDFAVLVYPVISLHDDAITHQGSKQNLLGPTPDAVVARRLSADLQITAEAPPTLLVHAADDEGVPVEHSRRLHASLQKAGIATDLHEYPVGGHGFGYGSNEYNNNAPAGWLDRVLVWLQAQGFGAF